ncbi:hypothetical protein HHK36_025861 [Tetracentron sinense]|uniref:Uncharacterized protein n=1 Tax=Tetracentron sinense TaxID=13715 RepID=A0A834YMA4_TETSI|nr:hypothetical protein HHK36_025861 [Tetracentron sinense]
MRPCLLVSILLLPFLIDEAHGIQLEQGFISAGHLKIHVVQKEKESSLIEASGVGDWEVVFCRNECSGRSRKLMAKTISTSTTTTSENVKSTGWTPTPLKRDGNEESFSAEHREVASERYPDIIDIVEKDYSPAKRKPPIHN